MSPGLRNKVCKLAPSDSTAALAVAEQIEEPLYASQAFAWCARYWPTSHALDLIDRSFQKASAGHDVHDRLALTAWPLRALLELGYHDRAEREFRRAAVLTSEFDYGGSRSEACFLVFQAVAIGNADLAWGALHWLLKASQPPVHWRQKRAVREAIIIAATLNWAPLPDLLALVQDESLQENTAGRFDRGKRRYPRSFFWSKESSTEVFTNYVKGRINPPAPI